MICHGTLRIINVITLKCSQTFRKFGYIFKNKNFLGREVIPRHYFKQYQYLKLYCIVFIQLYYIAYH